MGHPGFTVGEVVVDAKYRVHCPLLRADPFGDYESNDLAKFSKFRWRELNPIRAI